MLTEMKLCREEAILEEVCGRPLEGRLCFP